MRVSLQAIPSVGFADRFNLLSLEPDNFRRSIAAVVADTDFKALSFEFAPWINLDDVSVSVHGFVPPGWRTDALASFPIGKTTSTGVWNYSEVNEKNILAGLSYFLVRSKANNAVLARAQIEPLERPAPKLEEFVTVTGLAGSCNSSLSIAGFLNEVPMEMSPAQVLLARSAAVRNPEGRLEQTIGCAVRVGDAQVPGVGRIAIQMFGDQNPGKVESMMSDSDFPARMILDVHKRYLTAFGNFFTDTEQFVADNIERFPPFGVRFKPIVEHAPLRNEVTREEVGYIKLGWLVPLFYLDRSDFPSKLPLVLAEGEEE
jgi:hypothetical protein